MSGLCLRSWCYGETGIKQPVIGPDRSWAAAPFITPRGWVAATDGIVLIGRKQAPGDADELQAVEEGHDGVDRLLSDVESCADPFEFPEYSIGFSGSPYVDVEGVHLQVPAWVTCIGRPESDERRVLVRRVNEALLYLRIDEGWHGCVIGLDPRRRQ